MNRQQKDIITLHEFILWPNCKNNCKFCHQKKQKTFNEDLKIKSVEHVTKYVLEHEVKQVLLVGGELFDSNMSIDLYQKFFELVKLLWTKVEIFYINTNLIYEDISLLYEFMNLCPNISKLRLTTSYDFLARFKNEKDEAIFVKNFKALESKYPNLIMTINTILSKEVCKKINEEKNLRLPTSLEKINLIPPIQIPHLSPTRNEILTTLRKNFSLEYLKRLYHNFTTNQKRDLYFFNGKELEGCTAQDNDCGHNINFSTYSNDSNSCFICDLGNLINI